MAFDTGSTNLWVASVLCKALRETLGSSWDEGFEQGRLCTNARFPVTIFLSLAVIITLRFSDTIIQSSEQGFCKGLGF